MEAMKMKMDGTIRAKVIQYKRDGNTLTEKWHTLTKFAEGIYFSTTSDRYGDITVNIIFSKNGTFWRIGGEPEHYFNPDSFRYAENMETIKKRYANYEADILHAAANGGWLNKLHITVMGRLGHDTTALIEAYNEIRRKIEEQDRQRAEDAARREQQRKEAEERRKTDLLAEGKEKLMANKAVTVEQMELLADAVGYNIHIRTLGFMREKVSEAVLNTDETVTVWGRKLTQRNISGTADVLREIATRIKAQAKQEAQQPATPAEMPQISTEAAEAVNVSAEKKNEPETAKYRFTQNEIDEMKQDILGACEFNATALEKGYKKVFPEMGEYSALNIRRSYEGYINEFEEGSKNRKFYERRLALYESLTENDRPNFIQQPPPEPIKEPEHLPQPPKNAPQSHKVFPTANYTTLTPKGRGNARKRHCRRLGANGYAMLDNATETLSNIFPTPGKCSTANSPPTGSPRLTPYW